MTTALIVGTVELSLEDLDDRHNNRRIGVDACENENRVEITLLGFGRRQPRPIALTREEAEKLAAYLCLACSRGKR